LRTSFSVPLFYEIFAFHSGTALAVSGGVSA
jgi:hypothetical protein